MLHQANDLAQKIRRARFKAGALELDFPEIQHVARFNETWRTVATADRAFKEQVFEGDPDLFRVLPIPAVAGDLQTALDQPDRIAISRAMALKYFGRENVLGAKLEIDHGRPLVVSAVFEDLPGNTHLNFKFVVAALGSSRCRTCTSRTYSPY